nr:hypothetical protein 21 [Legionellales bacterium]
MEYYVFANETDANACIAAINGTSWLPIVGNCKGQPAPSKQQTTKWVENATEMLSGEYAVPRIPEGRLDHLGVPQAERDAFLATYGTDIRDLGASDFPAPPEE